MVDGRWNLDVHVLREAVEVLLLLSKLLLELEELLLLTLADSIVLGGTLAALEGIATKIVSLSVGTIEIVPGSSICLAGKIRHRGTLTLGRRSWGEHQYRRQPWRGR